MSSTWLCGLRVAADSYQGNLKSIEEAGTGSSCTWVVTLNTEMLAMITQDPEYAALIGSADMIVADGMPLVWASGFKRNSPKIPERTTGVDIVASLLAGECPLPFAVIGGRDPATTISRYPGADSRCRFIFNESINGTDDEIDKFCEEIQRSGASIVFIALGVPKQDRIAGLLRKRLKRGVLIGVGGSFEILSEQGGRAPVWMQRSGFEWLYRLGQEPGRLWRRYLLRYPRGLVALSKDCLGA